MILGARMGAAYAKKTKPPVLALADRNRRLVLFA